MANKQNAKFQKGNKHIINACSVVSNKMVGLVNVRRWEKRNKFYLTFTDKVDR